MRTLLLSFLLLMGLDASAQIVLPANMFADSAHTPYLWGVASGDPAQDGVILWTKVEATGATSGSWELASDSSFSQIVQSGNYTTDGSKDWTVLVEATGLNAGQFYWYRFMDGNNNTSVIGRTKTTPETGQANVRFAVASCSSVYSGFFNAYARIGERNDIDAVIHLGDYIYDFVDADEEVRVPDPYPTVPANLGEWRDRHEYYLLDPDLRLARQQHPWIVIWDNHDIDKDSPAKFAATVQAFREYVPMRVPDPQDSARIYRSFRFGNMVDLMVLDYEQYYHQDIFGSELSALGTAQRTWLLDQLSNSSATWKIVANQKMMGKFNTAGIPSQIPFGDGPVADSSAWDGQNLERTAILDHLVNNGIDNTVVLSGDIHMSFVDDLPSDYGSYNASTGAGSAAVEFLPSSITRGNFDEAGFGGFLATLAQAAISLSNSHHVYSELISHGYGILDIRPDRTVAEFWYSDKGAVVSNESFAGGYQVFTGDNHWDRSSIGSPSVYNPMITALEPVNNFVDDWSIFPQPANDQFTLRMKLSSPQVLQVQILEVAGGKEVLSQNLGPMEAGTWKSIIMGTENLASGIYLLKVQGDQGVVTRKISIEH